MCGIVCLCNYTQDISHRKEDLKAMSKLLYYRGPNDEGDVITPHVLMAHRRL